MHERVKADGTVVAAGSTNLAAEAKLKPKRRSAAQDEAKDEPKKDEPKKDEPKEPAPAAPEPAKATPPRPAASK